MSWSPALPTTYTHTLQVDLAADLPFSVTQSPLCGATLTYTLSTPNAWAYIVTDTYIEISAVSLALAGAYTFDLTA